MKTSITVRNIESEFTRLEREFTKTRERNVCTSYKAFCEALKQQQIVREKEFQGLLNALVGRDKQILAEVELIRRSVVDHNRKCVTPQSQRRRDAALSSLLKIESLIGKNAAEK